MNQPDQIFKKKLHDLETPLGSGASFDKVMAMRSERPAIAWWKPTLLVFATLSAVSVAAFFFGKTDRILSKQNPADKVASAPEGSGNQASRIESRDPQKIAGQTEGSNSGKSSETTGVADNHAGQPEFPEISTKDQTKGEAAEPQGVGIDPEVTENTVATNSPAFDELYGGLGFRKIRSIFGMYESNSAAFGLPARDYSLLNKNKHENQWAFEAMLTTATRDYKDFDGKQSYSIRGTHHFGNYSLNALYDIGKGWSLAAGFNYSAASGQAQWAQNQNQQFMHVNSRIIRIVQPGMPDVYETVYDTSYTTQNVTTTGNLKYRMNKMSLPIGFRYHIGSGRMAFRLSGSVAPGFVSNASGDIFTRSRSTALDATAKGSFTLDTRLGFGIFYPVTGHLSFVAEPVLMYQQFGKGALNRYRTISSGFGVGLVYKP